MEQVLFADSRKGHCQSSRYLPRRHQSLDHNGTKSANNLGGVAQPQRFSETNRDEHPRHQTDEEVSREVAQTIRLAIAAFARKRTSSCGSLLLCCDVSHESLHPMNGG